jgi:7-carboxy-7-deazaguanine synthase
MIPLNVQPPEHQVIREDGSLEVFHVWKTVQGEGPFAGMPAVFVRLSGCNLGGHTCPACDTDYTSVRKVMSVQSLIEKIVTIAGESKLIVITGGEPFRQNLLPFFEEADENDFKVQIETNGTLYLDDLDEYIHDRVVIVCSPKTARIHKKIIPLVTAWKYVLDVDHVSLEDGLPTGVLGMNVPPARPPSGYDGDIFLQPMDECDEERNKLHTRAVVDSCMKFGYRLSLQVHKLVGLE